MYFFANYTYDEKKDISKQLKEHTDEKAVQDYSKLRDAVAVDLYKIKPLSPVGLKFIENYVHVELLNTKSKYGISFYDFWFHRDFYMTRDKATKNLVDSIQKNKPYLSEIKVAKQVFNLYYGGISIFRPTNAAKLYDHFQPRPNTVLDFTMGWGGRLVGAALLNIPKYIGIDYNDHLKEPYDKMVKHLKTCSQTEIELHFTNALDIDYSVLNYDMVFTSPPFYNKEVYGDKETPKTKEEWDEQFYIPIFEKTWKHLQPGGYYCLNIPSYLYERVCVPMWGEAPDKMELKKYSRILPKRETKQFNVGQKYQEYIYIWHKA